MTPEHIGIEAYPLFWPIGRTRTPNHDRTRSRFECTLGRARDAIVDEVQLLVGKYQRPMTIISTNLALRRDGLPMASQRVPTDPGVAVYFMRKGKQMSFACDRWDKIEHNMQAIARTIEALRGIERWAAGAEVEAAFTGFLALPMGDHWRTTLGFTMHESLSREAVLFAYRRLAVTLHPDRAGALFNADKWNKLNEAKDKALQEIAS